jgi:cell division septation protein DedD
MAAAEPRRGRRSWGSLALRVGTGLLLLAVGVSLGIVAGTASNLPELLYRRARDGSQVVDLAVEPTKPADLHAMGDLESPTKPGAGRPAAEPAAPPRARAPEPAPAKAAPAKAAPDAAPPAARAAEPTRAAAREPRPVSAAPPPASSAPKTEKPPSAEAVMADIARRQQPGAAAGAGRVIQIASYTDRRAADALVNRLRKQGFDSFVSTTRAEGTERFRVRVRPAAGRDERQVASDLESRGFSVWVTSE